MSDRYYVRFRGRVLGPFTADKTTEMVRRGQVTRVHELSPDGLSWKKAEEFTEFFGKPKAERVAAVQADGNADKTAGGGEIKLVSPASPQWHVHVDGQELGPLDESVLLDWVRQGRVRGEHMVWRTGMSDWVTAESAQPNWFLSQASVANARVANSKTAVTTSGELDERLLFETTSKVPWLYILSVSITIVGVLSMIYAGVQFLQGVSIIRASRNLGTTRLVTGIITGTEAVMTLISGILLLRYTNTVSLLRSVPTLENAIRAAKRLSAFWFMTSLFMILLLCFVFYAVLLEILADAKI